MIWTADLNAAYSIRCTTIARILDTARRAYRIDHEYGCGCVREGGLDTIRTHIQGRMGWLG